MKQPTTDAKHKLHTLTITQGTPIEGVTRLELALFLVSLLLFFMMAVVMGCLIDM